MRPLSLTIFTSFAARSTEPSLVAAQIARLNVNLTRLSSLGSAT
jgi:hypothetical protein